MAKVTHQTKPEPNKSCYGNAMLEPINSSIQNFDKTKPRISFTEYIIVLPTWQCITTLKFQKSISYMLAYTSLSAS